MNVVVGPFSVFEIPSGATASLLRSKSQIVSKIPCASIRAVTVRQLSASESFFVSSERIASSVAWQQVLSSKITREQQIPCWASLGFFPGCRGLEASLGRRQRRITYASIHTFAPSRCGNSVSISSLFLFFKRQVTLPFQASSQAVSRKTFVFLT
jgi:hypothetical protein